MTALRRLPAVAVLVVAWLLLYGEPTVANIVTGAAVALAVVTAFPLEPASRTHRVHPVAAVRFAGYFAWLVVLSNLRMVATVIRPRPARLRAGIVRVELVPTTPLVTTLVANAVSLTPGSLTITADDHGVLHVHILGLATPDAVRAETAALHRRVLAAFEPRPEGPTS